jgi:hypothetical protein
MAMSTRKLPKVPQFHTREEERRYWEGRGPLTKESPGRLQRPKHGQQRTSFLAVRLTGEEVAQLRDHASKIGVGPSTFARMVLLEAIKQRPTPAKDALDELAALVERRLRSKVKLRA